MIDIGNAGEPLTLLHDSAASAPANRFVFPDGKDFTFPARKAVVTFRQTAHGMIFESVRDADQKGT